MQDDVSDGRKHLLCTTVDRMLGMVDSSRYRGSHDSHCRQIAIAGITVTLDQSKPSFEHQLERLASAIEATIAFERASAMLAAAGGGTGPVPLWLVIGSSALAQWLDWSRSEEALRRVLTLSDQVDTAPVAGLFRRSARAALGQAAVRIRVRNGFAVAEKIGISTQPRCTMTFGRKPQVTVSNATLPDGANAGLVGRSISALGGHEFFTAANLIITAARNKGQTVVVDLDHDWRPLAPVPEAALAAVPADADPACPWRPTQREVADLYALVDSLRDHGHSA